MTTLDALIAGHLARAVAAHAEVMARPSHVTQRTVERVVGMPGDEFLEHCRAGRIPSWKVRRLVYAHAVDVVAFIEANPAAARAANDSDEGADELARVGARRVAR